MLLFSPFSDLPVLSALKDKMQWHQRRQRLIAENVANANTPDYRARDLSGFSLSSSSLRNVSLFNTHNSHFLNERGNGNDPSGLFEADGLETMSMRNGVVLEEEMLKSSENQLNYRLATTLYSRSLGLLRTAVRWGR